MAKFITAAGVVGDVTSLINFPAFLTTLFVGTAGAFIYMLKLVILYCGGPFHYGLLHTAFISNFTSSCLLSAPLACSVFGLHFNSPCKRLRVPFFVANIISCTQPVLILAVAWQANNKCFDSRE
jgi:hypothetical protein